MGAWSYKASIHTCWFKQRYGWISKPDDDYVSGFKNQEPFYQQKTNLLGGDQMCEIGNQCRVKTENNEECQTLCDITQYCYNWSRAKSGSQNGNCQFKKLDGWKASPNNNYDSGFKNQWPFFEQNLLWEA